MGRFCMEQLFWVFIIFIWSSEKQGECMPRGKCAVSAPCMSKEAKPSHNYKLDLVLDCGSCSSENCLPLGYQSRVNVWVQLRGKGNSTSFLMVARWSGSHGVELEPCFLHCGKGNLVASREQSISWTSLETPELAKDWRKSQLCHYWSLDLTCTK